MKENRVDQNACEAKRLLQVRYMMDHWDELPERLQGRFEGTLSTVQDLFHVETAGDRR